MKKYFLFITLLLLAACGRSETDETNVFSSAELSSLKEYAYSDIWMARESNLKYEDITSTIEIYDDIFQVNLSDSKNSYILQFHKDGSDYLKTLRNSRFELINESKSKLFDDFFLNRYS